MNISLLRVRIELPNSRFYSHTLCHCATSQFTYFNLIFLSITNEIVKSWSFPETFFITSWSVSDTFGKVKMIDVVFKKGKWFHRSH